MERKSTWTFIHNHLHAFNLSSRPQQDISTSLFLNKTPCGVFATRKTPLPLTLKIINNPPLSPQWPREEYWCHWALTLPLCLKSCGKPLRGRSRWGLFFWGGDLELKTKKGGFNRISRMQTAGGENIGCGNPLWIFGWVIRPWFVYNKRNPGLNILKNPPGINRHILRPWLRCSIPETQRIRVRRWLDPYLEDHPRTRKWLGSPPNVSCRTYRPFGRGPTTRSLGDNGFLGKREWNRMEMPESQATNPFCLMGQRNSTATND